MNVLLTSCGLETQVIQKAFTDMLPKRPSEIKAMFIPTAANSPDGVEMLPKCLHDLTKCGIGRENIFVNDLHYRTDYDIIEHYDVVYLCGGSPKYLLQRIKENGFDKRLSEFIQCGGVVLGVSAGSMIFADDMPGNLGLLKCPLDVHCGDDIKEKADSFGRDRTERIRLGNSQAIIFGEDNIIIIE